MKKLFNLKYVNIDLSTTSISIIIRLSTEPVFIAVRLLYKPQPFLLLTYYRFTRTTIGHKLVTRAIIYVDYKIINIATYILKSIFYIIYALLLAPN